MKKTLVLFAMLSLLTFVPARGEDTNSILAVYNGKPITYSDIKFIYEFQYYILQAQAMAKFGTLTSMTESQRKEFEEANFTRQAAIVRQEIMQNLILEDGIARGILPLPKPVVENIEKGINGIIERNLEIRQWIGFLKSNRIDDAPVRKYIMQTETTRYVANRVAGQPDFISPAEMKKYYEEHKKEWLLPERIQLRVIRLPFADYGTDGAVAKGKELFDQLKSGAQFADLAKQHSKDSSAPKGGLWDVREPETYGEQVRSIITNLEEGAICEPKVIMNSVMIIKIEKRIPAGPKPFSEVRLEIKQILEQESVQRKQDRWINELYKAATIRYLDPNIARILEKGDKADTTPEAE